MKSFKKIVVFILLCAPYAFTILDDSVLYNVNWPGQSFDLKENADNHYSEDDAIIISTINNEKYKCMIPSSNQKTMDENERKNTISAVTLLSPLLNKKSCSYRLEAYWSYEICHGKHIRQYHEEKAAGGTVKLQEFFLGYFTEEPDENGIFSSIGDTSQKAEDIPTKKIDGTPTPYFPLYMKNGTPCGLKGGAKRTTKVLYVCHPESRNEIMSIAETSSCEYELIILTPFLCKNPLYKVKGNPVNEIYCQALDDSPRKPQSLVVEMAELEKSGNMFKPRSRVKSDEDEIDDVEPTKNDYRVQDSGISKLTDKALLKEFLKGDFCLKGGSGWWSYEFCYGKYVKQYHDDKILGRTIITVGLWDADAHMEWTKKSTPRIYGDDIDAETKKKKVRLVQHFYHNGDHCDEINKPRQVIVKLKCKKSTSTHAVTIYLLEPSTCSYILGVESPIICDLLDTADENGIFVSED